LTTGGYLVRSEHPRPDHEVLVLAGPEREALRITLAHVEDELRVLPGFVLTMIDVVRATTDLSQQDVMVTDDELSVREAHREAAVAATSRLEEHDRPAVPDHFVDGIKCGTSRHDARCF